MGHGRRREPGRSRARELRIGRRGEAVGSRAEDVRAQTLSDQTAGLWGVRFSPGGRVAAVGEDKSVSLYDYAA